MRALLSSRSIGAKSLSAASYMTDMHADGPEMLPGAMDIPAAAGCNHHRAARTCAASAACLRRLVQCLGAEPVQRCVLAFLDGQPFSHYNANIAFGFIAHMTIPGQLDEFLMVCEANHFRYYPDGGFPLSAVHYAARFGAL